MGSNARRQEIRPRHHRGLQDQFRADGGDTRQEARADRSQAPITSPCTAQMKRVAFTLLAAQFLLRAETPEQRGKRVVDECLDALGGDRFLNMQTRVESGRAYSFYRDSLTGLSIARIYTRYDSGVADTAHNLAQ